MPTAEDLRQAKEIIARSLLTKHGKYYELNPYKIIQRLENIRDYGIDDEDGGVGRINDLIDDMVEQGQLPG